MENFIDKRDGNHYKIIRIGNLYWFAENLKYQGVLHYAPNDDTDNIDKYGCLYDWENAQKACPDGWRLPTDEEFWELLKLTKSEKDSSSIRSNDWENGSNDNEFGAQPAGDRWIDGGFFNFGYYAYFWSSSLGDADYAYYLRVYPDYAHVYDGYRSNAYSVRCVKEV